ncbi:hypothetical protein DIPPA_02003 [Diplonema papillatum]|nr:hypothetical protein DIPPA_02003 [Diplonema papillatum]
MDLSSEGLTHSKIDLYAETTQGCTVVPYFVISLVFVDGAKPNPVGIVDMAKVKSVGIQLRRIATPLTEHCMST